MSYLLAIDPGTHSPAVAIFSGRILWSVGLVKHSSRPGDAQWHNIVCERPRIYRGGKADPASIIELAISAGRLVQRFAHPHDGTIEWVGADVWTKLVPKKVTAKGKPNPREKRIRELLTKAENEIMPSQHDCVDAVGIGLYHLGRLKPRRVYPGASDG